MEEINFEKVKSKTNLLKSPDFRDSLNSDGIHVTDIEHQLELAETKCGSLKQQLDYMKMLYHGSTDFLMNPKEKLFTNPSDEESLKEKENCCENTNKSNGDINLKPISTDKESRNQNQNEKLTGKSIPNVQVIKNILSGINSTVNRISKLNSENKDKKSGGHMTKRLLKSRSRGLENKRKRNKSHDEFVSKIIIKDNEPPLKTKNSPKTAFDRKIKNPENITFKKITKSFSNKTLCGSNFDDVSKRTTPEVKNNLLEGSELSLKSESNKVIELYHNNALKDDGCLSEEHFVQNKSQMKNGKEDVQNGIHKCYFDEETPCQDTALNSIRSDLTMDKETSKPSGNFLKPTISSKLKQVDRSLLNDACKLSFNKIPFVAGMATTQSHNLGLNIQQVLSIIKLKQQTQLSDSQLTANNFNKNNNDKEPLENEVDNQSTNGFRKTNYERILTNYIKDSASLSFLKGEDKSKRTSILNYQNSGLLGSGENEMDFDAINIQHPRSKLYRNIKGRIRGIREVLNSLYADYLRLNRIYKKLHQEIIEEHVIDEKTLKTLDLIEGELQAKEDEISVVMCLFKEVIQLKEHVTALRKTTMQMEENKNNNEKEEEEEDRCAKMFMPRTGRASTAAIRLTRLLRTIQKFQNKLKCEEML